jgi:proteasome lid subunit RPN8/RPN11
MLILPRRLALKILSAAQASQPNRMAGVVAANRDGACAFYPLSNLAANREASVVHGMGEVGDLKAKLQPREERVWAYVSSHPVVMDVQARVAVADFMDSPFPQAKHLRISLNTKGVLEMRAFYLREAEVVEEDLKIRD